MKPKKRSAATAGGSQSAAKSALEIHPSEQGEFNSASADCEDVPIYFLHIPKTAGSSLTLFLQSLYRESEICGLFPGWAELLKIPAAEISKRKLIRGHFGANFRSHYPGALRSFTFLRDPLARALSHYEHVSRDAGHYFHTLARELGSFSAYMRDPRTQPTVANFQLRHLAADFQPAAIASTLSERQLAERELERRLDTSDLEAPLEVLLERAMQRLEHMCFVGITEQFDRSLGLLCEVFGWPPPDSAPVTNVNPRSVSVDDLSDADRKLLTDLNAADLALYAAATSRFERDWSRSKFVYPDLHAFVSYAQNFEDVLLHRVLGHVTNGTYIDIGANDPSGDSVTRAFYDRGWSGINVEPVTALHEALMKYRERDVNLQIAAGASEGETRLYEIPGTGLSTLDSEIAARHRSTGFEVVEKPIRVQSLNAVLKEHACEEIHFLKVDVEGWEHDVLRGIDFTRHRPWIVVVEATEPNSEIPSFAGWEPLLVSQRYRFVYFDGLNRFYLAEEHINLVSAFSRPVNSADHFIRWHELSAKRELRRLHWGQRSQTAATREAESHVAALTEWATSADLYAKSMVGECEALRAALAAEQQSRETERRDAKEQIDALTEWATSGEVYAKSLVKRVADLEHEVVLSEQGGQADREEAQTQIDALTERAASSEAYGKALAQRSAELDSVLQARDTERIDTKKHIDALTESVTSADAYCQSLVKRVEQLESEALLGRQTLEAERAEVGKHVNALTEWATSADTYCKSLVEARAQLEASLASALETSAAVTLRSAQELGAAEERLAVANRRIQSLGAVRDRLEAAREVDSTNWQRERALLEAAVGTLEQRLNRLLRHWAVRALVGQNYISNLPGTKNK